MCRIRGVLVEHPHRSARAETSDVLNAGTRWSATRVAAAAEADCVEAKTVAMGGDVVLASAASAQYRPFRLSWKDAVPTSRRLVHSSTLPVRSKMPSSHTVGVPASVSRSRARRYTFFTASTSRRSSSGS